MTTHLKTILLATALAMTSLFTLAACDEGPAEQAGEKVDQAVEKAGEVVEDAGDAVKDATN